MKCELFQLSFNTSKYSLLYGQTMRFDTDFADH